MMKRNTTATLHRNSVPEIPVTPASSETGRESDEWQSLRTLLAQQPFFRGLSTYHLQFLTDSAREMHFAPGELILEEGSPAERFYIILEGRVVLGAELEDRGIVPVQTLGPGDGLGWSWLFPPYNLNLSARALSPTRTIFFYGARLREEAEQDHELGYQLMKRIAEGVIRRLRTTQQRLVECTSMRTLLNG
jgi:CRP-like cAMP-binding protein